MSALVVLSAPSGAAVHWKASAGAPGAGEGGHQPAGQSGGQRLLERARRHPQRVEDRGLDVLLEALTGDPLDQIARQRVTVVRVGRRRPRDGRFAAEGGRSAPRAGRVGPQPGWHRVPTTPRIRAVWLSRRRSVTGPLGSSSGKSR